MSEATPPTAAPVTEVEHCRHCRTSLPTGWRSKPVGRYRVCARCEDEYMRARIHQLEAGLSKIITKTRGAASDMATQLLYGQGTL